MYPKACNGSWMSVYSYAHLTHSGMDNSKNTAIRNFGKMYTVKSQYGSMQYHAGLGMAEGSIPALGKSLPCVNRHF